MEMTPEYKALLRDISAQTEQMERGLLSAELPDGALRRDLERVIRSGGKRLRPVLAYLCYRIGGREAYPILPLLCMLELMHTASLIHDDVVDNSAVRRGAATINKTSGAAAAVRAGDWLLAEAMSHLRYYRGAGINETLTEASSAMCLGELRQLKTRFDPAKQTREHYFAQVYKKTAGFIAAACRCGAVAGGLSGAKGQALRDYGEKLGTAFQLCDDLLDFTGRPEFGKEPGQDVKNGIFTLPIIYLLESGAESSVMELLIKKDKTKGDIGRILGVVKKSGAVGYTKSVIRALTGEAISALRPFDNCAEKEALTELAARLAYRSK